MGIDTHGDENELTGKKTSQTLQRQQQGWMLIFFTQEQNYTNLDIYGDSQLISQPRKKKHLWENELRISKVRV